MYAQMMVGLLVYTEGSNIAIVVYINITSYMGFLIQFP